MAYEPHILDALRRYSAGAHLKPGDPTLRTVTQLQRAGLLSAKPIDGPKGPLVRVRLTDLAYKALDTAANAKRFGDAPARAARREDRG